jgi:hypothetical protein
MINAVNLTLYESKIVYLRSITSFVAVCQVSSPAKITKRKKVLFLLCHNCVINLAHKNKYAPIDVIYDLIVDRLIHNRLVYQLFVKIARSDILY